MSFNSNITLSPEVQVKLNALLNMQKHEHPGHPLSEKIYFNGALYDWPTLAEQGLLEEALLKHDDKVSKYMDAHPQVDSSDMEQSLIDAATFNFDFNDTTNS